MPLSGDQGPFELHCYLNVYTHLVVHLNKIVSWKSWSVVTILDMLIHCDTFVLGS